MDAYSGYKTSKEKHEDKLKTVLNITSNYEYWCKFFYECISFDITCNNKTLHKMHKRRYF